MKYFKRLKGILHDQYTLKIIMIIILFVLLFCG